MEHSEHHQSFTSSSLYEDIFMKGKYLEEKIYESFVGEVGYPDTLPYPLCLFTYCVSKVQLYKNVQHFLDMQYMIFILRVTNFHIKILRSKTKLSILARFLFCSC